MSAKELGLSEREKHRTWRDSEKVMRASRDSKMKVSLPKLKCLEEECLERPECQPSGRRSILSGS